MTTNNKLNASWVAEYPQYAPSDDTATCLLSLRSPNVADEHRAPVSVSLVLDKSGSMAGHKLDLVKKTTEFLVKQLGVRDYVGVVAYDSQV
jgi:Mg-chelatase subunit ChlD